MNLIKQQILIAEACGWRIYKSNGTTYYERPGGNVFDHELSPDALPEYPTDLNAMHEAEKVLDAKLFRAYWSVLWEQFGPGSISATASQRAEAFLKTLGKWKSK